jgi:hypothetical protein
MPNINGIRSNPWTDYVVSASEIEADTGYQFFTTLDPNIAVALPPFEPSTERTKRIDMLSDRVRGVAFFAK